MITFSLNHWHWHWRGGGGVLWYLAVELVGARYARWAQVRETDLEEANNRCHHSPLLFSKPQMTKQGNVKIELFCFTKDFNGSSKRIFCPESQHFENLWLFWGLKSFRAYLISRCAESKKNFPWSVLRTCQYLWLYLSSYILGYFIHPSPSCDLPSFLSLEINSWTE